MKKLIIVGLIATGIASCTETVDTAKYKEELQARKIKHLTPAEIISFGHSEANKIAKDTAFTGSKIVRRINEVTSLDQCKTAQEREFYKMSVSAIDQLKNGVDLSNPVMKGEELLVVCPQLAVALLPLACTAFRTRVSVELSGGSVRLLQRLW